MNPMPNESTCPRCGKPVALHAFEGLCPECLMQAGFGTATGDPAQEKTGDFVPPTPEELARYFPQLEIVELVGRGGMGAVYQARQPHLDRIVALKILPPGIGRTASFAERFVREARALAQLHHPNIVTLYESGQSDELFYFLMEFVDGVNLRQLLAAGTVAPKDALAIVPQICDALQFAHDRGIVHRDIKPENILLSKAGQVKIADFGVAKIVGGESGGGSSPGDAPAEGPQTEAGKVIGTRAYMAPEQLSDPLEVDNRADIYALGVVFYQMLTGELPVGRFAPPSSRVQIDVRLDDVVLRALQKQPELRYAQASALKTQVQTIAGAPVLPRVPTPPVRQIAPGQVPPVAPSARDPERTGRILFAILRWFYVAGGIFLLTVLLGGYVTLGVLPKSYRATAIIQAIPRNSNANGTFSLSQPQAVLAEIQSREVLQPVIADLGLDKKWAQTVFKNEAGPVSESKAEGYLHRMITFAPVRGTNLFDIGALSDSPQEAADIANAIAKSYINYLIRQKELEIKPVIDGLQAQIDEAQKKIDDDQAKINAYQAASVNNPPAQQPEGDPSAITNLFKDRSLQQGLLGSLPDRLERIRAQAKLEQSPVSLVSLAQTPEIPFSPNIKLDLVLSVLAGFVFGILGASIVEMLFWLKSPVAVGKGAKPGPVPSASPVASAPAKGKYLAVAGAILQPASVLGFVAGQIVFMMKFSALSASGEVGLDQVADSVALLLEIATVSTIAYIGGLIFLGMALTVSRYRARWFFWYLAIYSWLLLPMFPIGTAAGIFFLVYSLKWREEFLGSADSSLAR